MPKRKSPALPSSEPRPDQEHNPLPSLGILPLTNQTIVRKVLDDPGDQDKRGVEEVASLMFRYGVSEPAARLSATMTPDGHPAFPYRLETVAQLAAALLKEGKVKQAAKDAVALLDACRAELSASVEQAGLGILAEREARGIASAVELPLTELQLRALAEIEDKNIPANMSLDAFMRYVTGGSQKKVDESRVRPFFKEYLRFGKAARALGLPHPFSSVSPDGTDEGKKQRAMVEGQLNYIPETPDAELDEWLNRPVFTGWSAKIFRRGFERWQAEKKSKMASEKGKTGGRGNTKEKREKRLGENNCK